MAVTLYMGVWLLSEDEVGVFVGICKCVPWLCLYVGVSWLCLYVGG